MNSVKIFAVLGFDEESYKTVYSIKEAATYIVREYKIPVDVGFVHVNLAEAEELRRLGLPTVIIDGRVIAWGYAPLPHEIVNAVFKDLEESVCNERSDGYTASIRD